MEASTSTEQDNLQLESMKQGDQIETSEPFQPMSRSTSPLPPLKIHPQLLQAGPRAGSGSRKIKPMVIPGHQGPLNNQHHVHWNHTELRAKKKFYKWCVLAILVISIAAALFFFLFYWK